MPLPMAILSVPSTVSVLKRLNIGKFYGAGFLSILGDNS